MDFGGLPPEINSARMYAGPGPGSMLASASAWDGLASELRSTALSYGTVTSELTDSTWQGPSAAAMEEAVTPYVAWLNSAAAEAEQTASQARAAASAYQTALTSMVPPEVIATNRLQLAMLNATNTFGQNTPAIATNEAQYGEMWAQDAAAMYSYAGNSAAAARVTPFTAPPSTTNPAGAATQSAATAQAVGTSSGAGVQSALSQLVSNVPNSLQSLASPAATTTPTSLSTLLTNFLSSLSSTSSAATTTGIPGLDSSTIIGDIENYTGLFALFIGLDAIGPLMGTPISTAINQAMAPPFSPPMPPAPAVAASMGGAAGGFAGGVGGFAGMGAAASVGTLSVPQGWGSAAAPMWAAGMPLATPLPGISAEVGEGMPFGLPVLPGGLGGAAGAAAAAGVGGAVASRYGPRLKVLSRSPGAGYSPGPMSPAAAGYGPPAGLPPAPGYTPHIVYLPNNGQNGHNGHNGHTNGHNGYNGYNGYTNGHNTYNGHNNGNGTN
jgi:PPE-repeat protein